MELLSLNQLSRAIELLKNGGVIVYPTETCYGLGCDATNSEAVRKLYAIKGRPEGKGFTLGLPASDPFGERYVKWDPRLRKLAEKYWPGPLNIILPVMTDAADAALIMPPCRIATECMTGSTISVRRSSHPIARALADGLGVPIVSTSANISGELEMYDARQIVEKFKTRKLQPDAVIDAGVLPRNPPSTIIALVNGQITIVRQGAVRL